MYTPLFVCRITGHFYIKGLYHNHRRNTTGKSQKIQKKLPTVKLRIEKSRKLILSVIFHLKYRQKSDFCKCLSANYQKSQAESQKTSTADFCCFRSAADIVERVFHTAVEPYLKVKMRTGRAAGIAHISYNLPCRNRLAVIGGNA